MKSNLPKKFLQTKYFSKLTLYAQDERRKKFLSIVLTFLALSFFGFVAINPTVAEILELRKELSDNKIVDQQMSLKIANLDELRIKYANLENDIDVVLETISQEPDIHLLFAQINTLANQANINIEKMQNFEVEVLNNQKESNQNFNSFAFAISGNGSFNNIQGFISAITSMRRIVSIDTLNLSNVSFQNGEQLTFDIQATAFFKR
jgi:Tfp pilus assembly protein PilO